MHSIRPSESSAKGPSPPPPGTDMGSSRMQLQHRGELVASIGTRHGHERQEQRWGATKHTKSTSDIHVLTKKSTTFLHRDKA